MNKKNFPRTSTLIALSLLLTYGVLTHLVGFKLIDHAYGVGIVGGGSLVIWAFVQYEKWRTSDDNS